MQIATATDQKTDPNAWKWADPSPTAAANTNDAVNLFSGTPSPNKIQLATTYENEIITGVPGSKPSQDIPGYSGLQPSLNGLQLENMALVLYGGWVNLQSPLSTILTHQYYIPNCTGKQGRTKSGGQTYLTCSTGWQWTPNANQANGLNYVMNGKSGVRDQLQ